QQAGKECGEEFAHQCLLGVGKKRPYLLHRAKRVPGTPLAPCAVRRVVMRKLLVLALAAASFSVYGQQADAPGKRVEASPKQDAAPQANDQAPASDAEKERIRTEGAAGGTRPVPPEKRKAVGAGAGPHRHDHLPSPAKLPRDEPVEPK